MRFSLALFSVWMTLMSCSSPGDPPPGPGPGPGPEPTGIKNYYVSPYGSDNNDGLAPTTPFKTIDKALGMLGSGEVVNLMNGTYSFTSPVHDAILLDTRHSGKPDQYTILKAMEGHKPVVRVAGEIWNAVSVNASYVVIEDIEFVGNNQNLNYEDAYQVYLDYKEGDRNWGLISRYNTNGISIGGPGTDSKLPHHIIVRNCIVHDFPGGGIGGMQFDYFTIENNVVYNNAWYTMYGCSGISVLGPFNSDESTDYKIKITGNFCHTNKTLVPWNSIDNLSDGNGIIIDVNIRPGGESVTDPTPYKGRTLVENNVSVNNGGSGIHTFKANHVDIFHNTAYNNGRVVGYADIHSNQCEDVKIMNNIMYANADNACNEKPGNNTNEVYDYNIYFGGKVNYQGPNDIVADPKFVNLSLDRLTGDFRLQADSPGINSASDGTNRGAYQ